MKGFFVTVAQAFLQGIWEMRRWRCSTLRHVPATYMPDARLSPSRFLAQNASSQLPTLKTISTLLLIPLLCVWRDNEPGSELATLSGGTPGGVKAS
ncbi:hypothetical protein BD310DRAFT_933239 [Dichomitus squalens]|uniref:Uncharacterized protein n=1 Tax=Dichomitus squalens TaxID=114155 RepID=A0A4Q9PN03_9APHY|nr:hypothetical protein BD310DRAFT_933239 [Dichomitus squalens]